MTYATTVGVPMDAKVLDAYLQRLVNRFFKILPLKEENDPTLKMYIKNFQVELMGCTGLVECLEHDSRFLSLVSILQYLSDNPDLDVREVRNEVFQSITICEKLKARYAHPVEAKGVFR